MEYYDIKPIIRTKKNNRLSLYKNMNHYYYEV